MEYVFRTGLLLISFCCLNSRGQVVLSELPFRVSNSPNGISANSIVGNFSGTGILDLLAPRAFETIYANPIFESWTQLSDGTAVSQFPGAFYQQGTPTVVVAGQPPSSVGRIAGIHASNDTFEDIIAVTTTGRIFLSLNHGQSRRSPGFADLGNSGTDEIFDLTSSASPFPLGNNHPQITTLDAEDFDGDGCEDFIYSGVETGSLFSSFHPTGIFIFWCISPGQYLLPPQHIPLNETILDSEWVEGLGWYALSQDHPTVAWTIPNATLTRYNFVNVGMGLPRNVLVSNPFSISYSGYVVGLATGYLNGDSFLDFVFVGNSLPSFGAQLQSGAIFSHPGNANHLPDITQQIFWHSTPVSSGVDQEFHSPKIGDLNNDGISEVLAILAHGDPAVGSPNATPAEIVFLENTTWTGLIQTVPLGEFAPQHTAHTPNYSPVFRAATNMIQLIDFDRDELMDVMISGLSAGNLNTDGVATLKNHSLRGPTSPFVEEFGSGSSLSRSPNEPFEIEITGNSPGLGDPFEVRTRSAPTHSMVGFNFDYSKVSFYFPLVSTGGGPQNLWIGVVPSVSSYTYFTSGAGGVAHPTFSSQIPNNSSLLGVRGVAQGILYDFIAGEFATSQGIEFQIGN